MALGEMAQNAARYGAQNAPSGTPLDNAERWRKPTSEKQDGLNGAGLAGSARNAIKHKCSKCGHVDTIKDKGRAKGGKSRWSGMTKAQRSEAMSKTAKARWSGSSPAPDSNA